MVGKKLLLLVTVVLAASLMACAEGPSEEEGTTEIPIGALVDLSGPLTTYGKDIETTTTIAKEEINEYFESQDMPYRVETYTEDTKVDPTVCLQKIQALYGRDVRMIVGPMGSGELSNVASYVDDNKILLVSPSSTAAPEMIGLNQPEDKKYIFRFVATDAFQTRAIAEVAKDQGVKAVVITHIGNDWGKGLDEFGTQRFEDAGIEVAGHVEYPDPPPSDFTPYVSTIEDDVDELLDEYEPNEIAVVTFSYEEVGTMLAQTDSDSILMDLVWIGCDGTAKSSKVTEDVPDKANKVGLFSTVSEMKGRAYDDLNQTYYERTGDSPKAYGLNAYDGEWVLALAAAQVHQETGSFDIDAISETIPEVAEKYSEGEYGVYPVSGAVELNEWNDRVVPQFEVYKVQDGKWTDTGTWFYENGTVVWE
ncbi:MAG: ABC transporter substrate-binding protein [Archaeoglobaceae archaeon]